MQYKPEQKNKVVEELVNKVIDDLFAKPIRKDEKGEKYG
jgi:hypothetical protein